jgi:hypothetical protein
MCSEFLFRGKNIRRKELELARQLKEEFGSSSKMGKKDKKDKEQQVSDPGNQ